ncbi:glutathione S-transferase family protein [Pseudaminobacter arsenicus]|uniref:Glutathione S-transferase family protein n=1 Tax=Borborobacter arsenicus TaxID=1851146 RepID=A0A432V7L8_9HYPH|nr:glutathione S-transferase family protein [Pseudaminobacter arsenicus]RUM98162.1 glutathione S-transferase family protein [Pseudaminobacter arsenicus]
MKLVGRYMSPFVRRVAVTARHYGLAYENVPLSTIDGRDGIKAFNPITRVPVIELADGTRIVDSSVIIDYFDTQVAPEKRLVPPAGAGRVRILSLTAIALGSAEKMILSYYEQHRRPAEFIYRPWVEACDEQAFDGYAYLESELDGAWLAGEDFSHADIAAAVAISTLRRLDAEAGERAAVRFPRLCALTDRCEDMPAFRGVPLP